MVSNRQRDFGQVKLKESNDEDDDGCPFLVDSNNNNNNQLQGYNDKH